MLVSTFGTENGNGEVKRGRNIGGTSPKCLGCGWRTTPARHRLRRPHSALWGFRKIAALTSLMMASGQKTCEI
jgi:hypothetical protein